MHYMVPMSYEWQRHCATSLGWNDPRGLDENGTSLVEVVPGVGRVPRDAEAGTILDSEREGTLMWPERFGVKEVAAIKAGLGPYTGERSIAAGAAAEIRGHFQT